MLCWRRLRIAPVALVTVLCCGCAGHHDGYNLKMPEMRHVSASRADAVSVNFSGAESDLFRLPFNGPQGIEISGIPSAPGRSLIISSGYDYSIFCNGRQVPSRSNDPCRKYNPYTYSESCDYPEGVSAKMTFIYTEERELYCEVTPFFWRAYCNRDEEGEERARSHSHTYDGHGGCEWPDTQEFLFYLHFSE